MPLLSPRFVALPAAALAVIFALAQAHAPAGARSEVTTAVHRVTNCAAPTNTLLAACAVAENAGPSVMR